MSGVIIEPMTEEFLLWRCLHGGPLSRDTIDRWPADLPLDWERYQKRNIPLLAKLTRTYGACAIIARDGDRIVGQLRFYPKVAREIAGGGGLCLQQDPPAGPADDFPNAAFPPLGQIREKTLLFHCMMTGSPRRLENPYQRKGIGSRMAKAMIRWAAANGWERIEVNALEDLPVVYEITGGAGRSFWEKLGFTAVDRRPHPDLGGHPDFVKVLDDQAKLAGLPVDRAHDQIVMRLDLHHSG